MLSPGTRHQRGFSWNLATCMEGYLPNQFLLRIPVEFCHQFRLKPATDSGLKAATDSGGSLPLIPVRKLPP